MPGAADYVTPEGKKFGTAVKRQLGDRSQRYFGDLVARTEGRSKAYSQQVVSSWLQGKEPNPRQAVAIEEVLGVEPGTLTRILGFVSADSRPIITPAEAIAADVTIGPEAKAILTAGYEAARSASNITPITKSRRRRSGAAETAQAAEKGNPKKKVGKTTSRIPTGDTPIEPS